MPVLESKADESAVRRTLLATGLGVLFGLQGWQLAEYGFAVPIPWYGLTWIFLSHVFLGFSVGATAGSTRWWKRGLALGLVFSIPSALGVVALGLRGVPYGIAAITGGPIAGLLLALIVDSLLPLTTTPGEDKLPMARRPESVTSKPETCRSNAAWTRLVEEKACLEHLECERAHLHNPGFGKTSEERIIWGELLDLELQDIDEQVSRICQAAGISPAGAGKCPTTTANAAAGPAPAQRKAPVL